MAEAAWSRSRRPPYRMFDAGGGRYFARVPSIYNMTNGGPLGPQPVSNNMHLPPQGAFYAGPAPALSPPYAPSTPLSTQSPVFVPPVAALNQGVHAPISTFTSPKSDVIAEEKPISEVKAVAAEGKPPRSSNNNNGAAAAANEGDSDGGGGAESAKPVRSVSVTRYVKFKRKKRETRNSEESEESSVTDNNTSDGLLVLPTDDNVATMMTNGGDNNDSGCSGTSEVPSENLNDSDEEDEGEGEQESEQEGGGEATTADNQTDDDLNGDDMQYSRLLLEYLSSADPPDVPLTELKARSALLQWSPPKNKNPDIEIEATGTYPAPALHYSVLLTDESQTLKYKLIYFGPAHSCRVQDLRPCTEYSVCLRVHLDEAHGCATTPVTFTTPPGVPDAPSTPLLYNKTNNSIGLRWRHSGHGSSNVNNNGSGNVSFEVVVTSVPYDGMPFTESHRIRGRTFTYNKLRPMCEYRFKVAAINDIGSSAFTEEVSFHTGGALPEAPHPPHLLEAGSTYLHLGWHWHYHDNVFTLQMLDPLNPNAAAVSEDGSGFVSLYHGRETQYVCHGLNKYTYYKFRLRIANEVGSSPYSEEAGYRTLSDKPTPPLDLRLKGRPSGHKLHLQWDPPADNGGSPIAKYTLEINDGSGYRIAYCGRELEGTCERLEPGYMYHLRVLCESEAGSRSDYSDPVSLTTEAVCPSHCLPPKIYSKPKQHSLQLKWALPENSGGAPVTEMEVKMKCVSGGEEKIVFRGKEMETNVLDLSPGTQYMFQLRAYNSVGPGPWSEPVEYKTAAGSPSAPEDLQLSWPEGTAAHLQWREGANNGSVIKEYRLEMAAADSNGGNHFTTIYQGSATMADVKSLTPSATYHFKVQAANSVGWSTFSPIITGKAPCSSPACVTGLKYEATADSIHLMWAEPNCNGSPITRYQLEIGPSQLVETSQADYTLENLAPLTTLRVRVRAENNCGWGVWSSTLKVTTKPLPPGMPTLECANVTHNAAKLKWSLTSNTTSNVAQLLTYQLVVDSSLNGGPANTTVYQGSNTSFKLSKLCEQSTYRVKVAAANISGSGPFSDIVEIRTTAAPPILPKSPRISEITNCGCTVEFVPISRLPKCDTVIYCVQVAKASRFTPDFAEMYRGRETRIKLTRLDSKCEYVVRVMATRQVASTGQEICGPFTANVNFITHSANSAVTQNSLSHNAQMHNAVGNNCNQKNLSDLSSAGSKCDQVDDVPPEKDIVVAQYTTMLLAVFLVVGVLFALFLHYTALL